MKQKVFTLLTLLVLCVTGAWADAQWWKATSSTVVTAGTKYVNNDLLTVETVYGGTISDFGHNYGGDANFEKSIQVRTNAAPTTEVKTGTEKSGSTPLVITAKKDVIINFYYHRQAASSAYTSNDGKDMKMVDQAAATTVLDASSFTFVEERTSGYGYVIKTYALEKDHIYTVYAVGTTVGLQGFSYAEPSSPTPSTSVVVNAAKSNQISYLDNSGAISGSKEEPYVAYAMSYTSIPLKVVCSTADANESIQAGSDNYKFTISGNDYTAFKVLKGKSYTIEPLNGAVINSVTAYGSSNSGSASQISTYGGASLSLAARGASGTPATPTGFSLAKNASGKFEFTIGGSASQAIVVLVVNYDTPEIVDLTVSSAGYATLYYDKKLAIPAGVTAYSASVSGANALLTPIADVIPANTGVILKGDAGTYKFVVTSADAPDVSGNVLKGTTSATTVDDIKTYWVATKVFTLGQNVSSEVGLREYSGTDIRAYCAYAVDLSFGPGANFFSFDEDVTAINKVEAKKVENGVYYNLAGQQVAQPSKGLYILNGKKVVLK